MRNIRVRAFESTPGQLYWRRLDPAIMRMRNGLSAVGRFPLVSSGFIDLMDYWFALLQYNRAIRVSEPCSCSRFVLF